jgi:adenosylcobinamide-phosphate synthase
METKAFIASLSLLLNVLFGGPRSLHAKLRLTPLLKSPERLVSLMERKLNRERLLPAERHLRGQVLMAAALFLALLLGMVLERLVQGSLLQAVVVACALSLRGSFDRAFAIHTALIKGNPTKARELLSGSLWRNYSVLDEHGMARAAIENLAVDFCDKVVAPLCWFFVFGLPGVFIAKTTSLLSDRLRPYSDHFGRCAQQVERVVLQPGRIGAALLIAAGCFLPFTKPLPAAMLAIASPLRAPSRLLALTVMGATLNLSLGGPMSPYGYQAIWFGGQVARSHPRDITRALMLTATATLLLLLLLFLLAY